MAQGPQGSSSHVYSYILYIDDAFKPCVHMLPFAPLFSTPKEKKP